jgi:hypothetical protein
LDLLTPEFFNNSLSCNPEVFEAALHALPPSSSSFVAAGGSIGNGHEDEAGGQRLLASLATWVPITVVIAIPMALSYLLLFECVSRADGQSLSSQAFCRKQS